MKKLNKSELKTKHLEKLAKLLKVPYEKMKVIHQFLTAIEMNGHKLAEDYCNGVIDSESYEKEILKIKERLTDLIENKDILKNIYLNGDPRGYFLKIDDDYMRLTKADLQTDWGGYGIIAPTEY